MHLQHTHVSLLHCKWVPTIWNSSVLSSLGLWIDLLNRYGNSLLPLGPRRRQKFKERWSGNRFEQVLQRQFQIWSCCFHSIWTFWLFYSPIRNFVGHQGHQDQVLELLSAEHKAPRGGQRLHRDDSETEPTEWRDKRGHDRRPHQDFNQDLLDKLYEDHSAYLLNPIHRILCESILVCVHLCCVHNQK